MGTRLEERTGNLIQYTLHDVLKNKDQVLDRDELREYCQELNEAGPGTDAAVHPKRLNL